MLKSYYHSKLLEAGCDEVGRGCIAGPVVAASIIFPLLPLIGLESEMGKVWVIMAIGTGAMTVSHANDSYFWIVSQMSGMDVKTAYRTHTLGTLIQGTLGIVLVFIGFYLWKIIF